MYPHALFSQAQSLLIFNVNRIILTCCYMYLGVTHWRRATCDNISKLCNYRAIYLYLTNCIYVCFKIIIL